jgi:hypothetical protein
VGVRDKVSSILKRAERFTVCVIVLRFIFLNYYRISLCVKCVSESPTSLKFLCDCDCIISI